MTCERCGEAMRPRRRRYRCLECRRLVCLACCDITVVSQGGPECADCNRAASDRALGVRSSVAIKPDDDFGGDEDDSSREDFCSCGTPLSRNGRCPTCRTYEG